MRSPGRPLVALLAALVGVGSVVGPVAAEDLPPGFTDGKPVGEEGPSAVPTGVGPAAATQRYFGEGAYAAVRSAVTATSRSCSITDDGLTAMVLAPVFKESSAATTAATAPSPMTLSRYDEVGVSSGNEGLYAFRNPQTSYPRAYWHPGIGIWQYDSAGLGAPLTTIEAMDVGFVAAEVARVMSTRYCASTATTALDKRYAAWRDWGFPCGLCEGFYQEMIGTEPNFANLNMVAGIDRLGGVVQRTCSLAGVAGTMPCWYVNPSVGVIQGATAWATFQPDGYSDPNRAPTPVSKPFYVIDRGTTEERHWLREDSDYSIDIRASRNIGQNARPKSGQSLSGLTWSSTSGLCDLTAGKGVCVPQPPAGVSSAPVTVVSSARPTALDADGDGRDDVLWFSPGAPADLLWMGEGGGDFSAAPISITGVYDDVLAGDVDGDGDDDVVLYNRSTGSTYLLRSNGNGTFAKLIQSMGAGRRPFLLDADGNGDLELFWYGAGTMADALWNWSGSSFSKAVRAVPGPTYTPLVGDYDGNGRDDILWYVPGSTVDKLWLHKSTGGYSSLAKQVVGTYRWTVGDLDGDGKDDIVWYAPGSAADSVWFGGAGGAFSPQTISIFGDYTPVIASLDSSGRKGVILYAAGPATDHWFRWTAGRVQSDALLTLPGAQKALVGGFSTGGADGILWYAAGSTPDVVWYR